MSIYRERELSMYLSIYIYTHTHTHTHLDIYIRTCTSMCVYIHTCLLLATACLKTYADVCRRMYTYVLRHIRAARNGNSGVYIRLQTTYIHTSSGTHLLLATAASSSTPDLDTYTHTYISTCAYTCIIHTCCWQQRRL
jgi:hypothetical protein